MKNFTKIKIMNNRIHKNTIMIAAGGTGGHIFPSLSIINQIQNHQRNIQNISSLIIKNKLIKQKVFYPETQIKLKKNLQPIWKNVLKL